VINGVAIEPALEVTCVESMHWNRTMDREVLKESLKGKEVSEPEEISHEVLAEVKSSIREAVARTLEESNF
jgi:hypothetical protein